MSVLGRAVAWSLVFLLALVMGALIHLDSPPLRAALGAMIHRALENAYRGRIELSGIEELGAWGAAARELTVLDEGGNAVLGLTGVRLGYRPWDMVRAFSGQSVELEHVRVDEARISLTPDPSSGEWTLVRALSKPPKSARSRPSGKAPTLYELRAVEVGRLELSLDHPSLGPMQARVDRLRGSATLGGPDSSIDVERFGVRLAAFDGWTLEGTGSARLLPRGYAAATFHGFLDGVELDAAGQLDDGVLTARLDVPEASPERLRERIAGWPLLVPVALQLRAQGPPERLQLEATLRASESELHATGSARLAPAPSATLVFDARALDARSFGAALPPTRANARGTLRVEDAGRGSELTIDMQTEPTRVADFAVPALTVSLRAGGGGPVRGDVAWDDERGRVEAHVEHAPTSGFVISARAGGVDLAALPHLTEVVRGRADLSARAQISEGRFTVELTGELRNASASGVRLAGGHIAATARGRVDQVTEAQLDANLSARQVAVGALQVARASWTSRGTWRRSSFNLDVQRADGSSGAARGVLEVAPDIAVSRLDATWSTSDARIQAKVGHWFPERGQLEVDALSISGRVGSLRGSGRIAADGARAELDAEALDLRVLARALAIDLQRASGRVTGRAELDASATGARGAATLRIDGFGVHDLALGDIELAGRVDGRRLEAEITSAQTPLGRLQVTATGDLAGSVLEAAAWTGLTGKGSVRLERLPLWPVGVAVAARSPVRELDGHLDAALQVERDDASTLPNVFFEATTSELAFALAADAQHPEALTRFDQVRLHGSASLAGETGQGAASLRITDQHGDLITTSGTVDLDWPSVLRDPGSTLKQLLEAPLNALVRLHQRPISLLPAPFGARDVAGSVEAVLLLRGSLVDPRLELTARGHQLLAGLSDLGGAVDVTSRIAYTPATGVLSGVADVVQRGQRLVTGRLAGRVNHPLDPGNDWRDLELEAAAMLNGVPLELLPQAARNDVTARVYGSVAIQRSGQQLAQRAQLTLGEVRVAGHALGDGRLMLEERGSTLRAELQLGRPQHDLRVQLRGVPAASEGGLSGFEGSLSARGFDAASLSPLVRGTLSRVSGAVNAELAFTARPSPDDDWYLGIDGEAAVEQGGAQLDVFGLSLRDLSARIRARSTPEYTVIQVEPVTATARSRRPNFAGDAELWLKGLRVVSGEANLSLDDVPLTVGGASRMTARGRLRGRLEREPDHMALEIKIPELRVQLPSSTGRSLIALEPNPDVRVLQAKEKPEREPRDPLLWRLAFDLGEDVRIQRSDLDVSLSGAPRLDYRTELRPSGTIETGSGGQVTLFDQRFSIDRGIVEFVPDEPTNPRVEVTASWQAPDGTTVYVDITGRAKQASVSTRDDRGLEDVERFYLLTGSIVPDDAAGGDTTAEGAVLGQTVAFGLNEVLRDTLGNVAVSVGTRDDRASYGASVRLTDKLTFEGSFQPGSESNLEESANDLTGTLDYRFSRSWSLRTELGTSGAAFDLLWSHRY